MKWAYGHAQSDVRFYFVTTAAVVAGIFCIFQVYRLSVTDKPRQKEYAASVLKGLSFYSEDDGEYFTTKLERYTETEQILGLLDDTGNAFIVVVGPSGCGKTSLLRAGVNYRLHHPAEHDARGVVPSIYWPAVEKDSSAALAKLIETETDIDCCGDPSYLLKDFAGRLVIIIDQFERLDKNTPDHKPIFDLIRGVCRQQRPHKLQVMVSFNSTYMNTAWFAFEDELSPTLPRKYEVPSFSDGTASAVMKTLLEDVQVTAPKVVIERYIYDVNENGKVPPWTIALGALNFSKRDNSGLSKPLSEYQPDNAAAGILTTHLSEAVGPTYVPPQDRDSLLRALMETLVSGDHRKVFGESVDEIAKKSNPDVKRTRKYLEGLVECRILEKDPGSNNYALTHDLLVVALKALTQKIEKRVVDRYYQWKEKKEQRQYLLKGKALRWVLININSFLVGPDAEDRKRYLFLSEKARKYKYYGVSAALLILVAASYEFHDYYVTANMHQELRDCSLPSDLYERQKQLQELSIEQLHLKDLKWLRSSQLEKLTVKSSLESLEGLDNPGNLKTLDIDLAGVQIKSLKELSGLHTLQKLTLENISKDASQELGPALNGLKDLTELELDFQPLITQLPDLGKMSNLKTLTLNLRLTSISDLSPLSKLSNLSSLTLFLEGSKVVNLKPLASLKNLQTLDLGLNEVQAQHLTDLSGNATELALTLRFSQLTGPPQLPSGPKLVGLELWMFGSTSDHFPDMGQLAQLHSLKIVVARSPILPHSFSLPDLDRMNNLDSLEINVQSARISGLPKLPMTRLERLSLNLSGTNIKGLAKLSYGNINDELRLTPDASEVDFANGLRSTDRMQTLMLDLRGSNQAHADTITLLKRLEKLILYLRWAQVNDLPALAAIQNLHYLELHFDNRATVEELPDLSHLHELKELKLYLENAQDFEGLPNLSALSEHLQTMELDLENTKIQDLTALSSLKGLQSLSLNLRGNSRMESLPDLTKLPLNEVKLDIAHSQVKNISQLKKLGALRELTIDNQTASLKGLPETVRVLHVIR